MIAILKKLKREREKIIKELSLCSKFYEQASFLRFFDPQ